MCLFANLVLPAVSLYRLSLFPDLPLDKSLLCYPLSGNIFFAPEYRIIYRPPLIRILSQNPGRFLGGRFVAIQSQPGEMENAGQVGVSVTP